MKTIVLGQWDGAGDGWRAQLPLRVYSSAQLVVDAQSLRFATPTFLLRLRSFVEWHLGEGRTVRVLRPSNSNVANYMARMHLAGGLPDETFDLPAIRERDRGEVLIPVTRLTTAQDVDRFNEEVAPVIRAQVDDVAVLEEALSMAIAELCGNGVEQEQARSASVVEIDFEGVKGVSYSFADEFVGELAERAAKRNAKFEIALAHVPHSAERVIFGSLERRGLDRAVLAYA